MMSHDFSQFAELWQEQIAPEELAELQAMAKNIERIARRKRLLDLSLTLGFIGIGGLATWIYPASLQVRFVFILIVAAMIWGLWRRHQLAKVSRATAIHDPRAFFEKAIKNVRAELKFSTISLWLMAPAIIGCHFLMSALRGLDSIELLRLELSDEYIEKTMVIVIIWIIGVVYFVRDNIKMREQLRRLQSMSREWDDQQERDLAKGP